MSIYDSLLQIPLFKGLDINSFNEIIEKYRVEFLSFEKDSVIISAGEECDCFKFVISGSVKMEFISESVKIKLYQTISAPNDILSNYALGNNFYPASVTACEENTGILSINKQDFLSIVQEHRVILLNYLISLSRKSQTPFEAYNLIAVDNIRAKFAFWVLFFTDYRATDIYINAKQRDMYFFFGAQRSLFISVLDEMKEKGILDYSPNGITVFDRNLLRLYYRDNCEG